MITNTDSVGLILCTGSDWIHYMIYHNAVVRYGSIFRLSMELGIMPSTPHSLLVDRPDNYRLNIGGYSGNTGFDAMIYHNNMEFSTYDSRPDQTSCAFEFLGGWWYKNCCTACLTVSPNYLFGWFNEFDGDAVSLKEVEIRFVC